MPVLDINMYAHCAPQVAPATLAAIMRVESGGNPLALHDNTTGRSYQAATRQAAQALLNRLVAAGHSVDVGLMQVNSRNFKAYHLTTNTAFDTCENVRAGGAILTAAWTQATSARLTGQAALYHAVQAYNSGNLHGAPGYANKVWYAAGAKRGIRVAEATYPIAAGAAQGVEWQPDTTTWGKNNGRV